MSEEEVKIGSVESIEQLLRETGTPDPKLLEGSTWDAKHYRQLVDWRIHMREELLFQELGVDRGAFELARRLHDDAQLCERVEAIRANNDLRALIQERICAILREERSVQDAWLRERMERCERCGKTPSQWYEIRYTRRLCEACAESLARRQRSTSTNIGPALATSRRHKLPATLTIEEWLTTIACFDDHCAYCGGNWDVVEHVTPTDRGGGTMLSNCLPACHGCNIHKRSRTLEEWISEHPPGKRKEHLQSALDWLLKNGRTPEAAKE